MKGKSRVQLVLRFTLNINGYQLGLWRHLAAKGVFDPLSTWKNRD